MKIKHTIQEALASIRTSPTKDEELRTSMQAKGWLKNLPGIRDDKGMILVGNRRKKIADDLNIKPVFITVENLSEKAKIELATASNIGAAGMTAKDRKRIAIALDGNDYTQQQIAEVIGVSQKQISRYLEGLDPTSKPHRPRGGRPRGSGRKGKVPNPKAHYKDSEIVALSDAGMTMPEIAKKLDIATRTVRRVLEAEGARREGAKNATVDPSTLSLSAQQKLEIAKRAIERKFNAEHAARLIKIDEEVRERVLKQNKDYLDKLKKMEEDVYEKEKWYRKLINDHKPPFTGNEFKTILMCLHPDGVRTASKLNEAFRLFNAKKIQLTGEK